MRRSKLFIGFLCVMVSVLAPLPVFAQEAQTQFVKKMTDNAIAFLANPDLTTEDRKNEFRKLLRGHFDLPTIGRFVLGKYWKDASPAQQQEYQKLFAERVVNIYANRFKEYDGHKVEIRETRPEGKDFLVTTFIVSDSNPPVQVDWRVRTKSGVYKIVDVVVEGVSMSVTQRSDYASVIQSGGGSVEFLLEQLRAKPQ
jgi:phospholipid transport system substrate-binding protein